MLKSAWATGSLVPALISQRVCAAWGLCLISCWGWPPAAGSTPQACFVLQGPPGLLQTGFLAADCMGQCNEGWLVRGVGRQRAQFLGAVLLSLPRAPQRPFFLHPLIQVKHVGGARKIRLLFSKLEPIIIERSVKHPRLRPSSGLWCSNPAFKRGQAATGVGWGGTRLSLSSAELTYLALRVPFCTASVHMAGPTQQPPHLQHTGSTTQDPGDQALTPAGGPLMARSGKGHWILI